MHFNVISLDTLRNFDLGEDFIREIAQTYVQEIPQYLDQAESSRKENRLDELRRILHTLKSHSKTLGMEDTHEKLTFWEKEIMTAKPESFNADFSFIKDEWAKALEDLKVLQSMKEGGIP